MLQSSKKILLYLLFFPITNALAQISFTASGSSYTENFNALPNTPDGSTITWTDNSTISGFYVSPSAVRVESSTSSMSNTGGPYIIASGTDRSIGSRASGTSPNNNIFIGVRFKNNTGLTLQSIQVSYYGEQWSIAENGVQANALFFHYQKSSSSITSLTSGSWTAVSALNFSQLYTSAQSASMGGTACSGTSNQCLSLNGNLSSNRVLMTTAFNVTLNPGDEIMLRWNDPDNTSNDHHLQIDDLIVTPWDVPSSVVLPVELLYFTASCHENQVLFNWMTASERDNESFTVEQSTDGILFEGIQKIPGAGNSSQSNEYNCAAPIPVERSYFRLKQTDFNGVNHYSELIESPCERSDEFKIYPNPTNNQLHITKIDRGDRITVSNQLGQELEWIIAESNKLSLDFSSKSAGIYYLIRTSKSGTETAKILVTH